jgi:hypothetical protein
LETEMWMSVSLRHHFLIIPPVSVQAAITKYLRLSNL